MQSSGFIQIFLEVYDVGAAFIILFLIGQITYMMRKVDKNLLKAKLFLNKAVMQRTWMYLSIAGASFALNAFIKFATVLTVWGAILNTYRLFEITQLVFVIAFIMAVYNWCVFITLEKLELTDAAIWRSITGRCS